MHDGDREGFRVKVAKWGSLSSGCLYEQVAQSTDTRYGRPRGLTKAAVGMMGEESADVRPKARLQGAKIRQYT